MISTLRYVPLLLVSACGAATTPTVEPAVPAAPPPTSAAPAPTLPAMTAAPVVRDAGTEELLRIRCATDGRDVYTSWTGAIYSAVPGQRQQHLFDMVGVNVIRCLQHGDGWAFTSREVMFYLDPQSGEVLDQWKNPWTDETVPVVHVANRVVQAPLPAAVAIHESGALSTVRLDIPLFYPNPLARDARAARYGAGPHYQAGEFFIFTAPTAEVTDETAPTVTSMSFGWHRVSQWLPWMDMGERPGSLIYSAQGQKIADLHQAPALVREAIETKLPLYRTAPACYLAGRSVSSWSYFLTNLDAYLAGETFPLPAPVVDEPCAEPAPENRPATEK